MENKESFEERLIAKSAELFRIELAMIYSGSRHAEVVRARTAVSYILHKIYYLKAVDVGNMLGNKNHSSITHYCLNTHPQLMSSKNYILLYKEKYETLLKFALDLKPIKNFTDKDEILERLFSMQSSLVELIYQYKLSKLV